MAGRLASTFYEAELQSALRDSVSGRWALARRPESSARYSENVRSAGRKPDGVDSLGNNAPVNSER